MSLRYPDVTAHRLVAETAVKMAEEVYEELMSRSNTLYKVHKNRKDFIQRCAPTLRQQAREILATMLTMDDVSQTEKDKIYEALILDAQLPKTGTSVVKKGSW